MFSPTAGLLAALAWAPAPSPPAVPAVELGWQAPAVCPDADAVRLRLRALALEPSAGPGVRVEAIVTAASLADGPPFRLQFALRGPQVDERRSITAGDCEVLADVTALLIAIALTPESVARRVLPAPPPASDLDAPTPTPTSEPTPPASPRIEPPVREPWPDAPDAVTATLPREPVTHDGAPSPGPRTSLRGAVRVHVGAEVGAVPQWSPTAGLLGALLGRRWRVELAGTYAARRLAYASPAGVGGALLLAAGAVQHRLAGNNTDGRALAPMPRWEQFRGQLDRAERHRLAGSNTDGRAPRRESTARQPTATELRVCDCVAEVALSRRARSDVQRRRSPQAESGRPSRCRGRAARNRGRSR